MSKDLTYEERIKHETAEGVKKGYPKDAAHRIAVARVNFDLAKEDANRWRQKNQDKPTRRKQTRR